VKNASRECALNLEVKAGKARFVVYTPQKFEKARAVMDVGGEPVDDWAERIGFREIRVAGKRILLNGAPLRLRGANA
jgi:hypothetical protein